ncbi:hypothetical protein AAKU67_004010 [Oxalobacteraceae bacterium GrIS 2.11]
MANEIQPTEWDLHLISILEQMPEPERNRMMLVAEALVAMDREPTKPGLCIQLLTTHLITLKTTRNLPSRMSPNQDIELHVTM